MAGMRQTIEEMGKEYQKLLDQYYSYLFGYSERIEEVAEARMAYEEETEKLRQMIRQYQKEAEAWLTAMKKTGKGGVGW